MVKQIERQPSIIFYRAIMGSQRGGIFLGYPERTLKSRGILLENYSWEQDLEVRDRGDYAEGQYSVKPAAGLLVVTTEEEALGFLRGRFSGLPGLVSLEFSLAYFKRKTPGIRLFRHSPDPAFIDYEITPSEIIDRVMAGTLETGEYFLQGGVSTGVPNSIRRRREKILVPNGFRKTGSIDFNAGFREI